MDGESDTVKRSELKEELAARKAALDELMDTFEVRRAQPAWLARGDGRARMGASWDGSAAWDGSVTWGPHGGRMRAGGHRGEAAPRGRI
jgi:hypothetical protein